MVRVLYSLRYCIVVILIFSVSLNAQPIAYNIFEHLNLDYPGLEKVKKEYQDGNISEAKKDLLDYFQNRTNRKLLETEKIYSCDLVKANQNVNNRFTMKSSAYDFGDEIDWTKTHSDMHWHLTLNRMKWFKNYVGAYQQTGDEKYVQAWMNQINSWLELGAPGYPRTLEVGRRLENWIISYCMFVTKLKSPSVNPEFNAKMLLSMAEQAEFLYNPDHWRRFSNWGSFENSGFAMLVIMFPEFKRNNMWLREIYFRMYFQLSESFHPDGTHIEGCPSYHSHELEVWFEFLRLAAENGVSNPWLLQMPLRPWREIMLPMADALVYWYKPTGVFPQIGDTDENDERDLLFDMGKYWNRPKFLYVATDGKNGKVPDKTSMAFPDGGYYIMRSGWGEGDLSYDEELYLLFDCGTNYPWHAHYDILNIVATAYGYDLLKDAGRFTYNEGAEREAFKSTSAHNTIVIDGQNQQRRYSPPKAEWHSLCGFDYVVGSQSYRPEITHQRSVYFAKPEYWIIVDRLIGKGNHRYDQYWHLSDKSMHKVTINKSGNKVDAPHLQIYLLGDDVQTTLDYGFLSYHYRQKTKAPVIRCSLHGKPPVVIPTILFPVRSDIRDLNVKHLQVVTAHKKKTKLQNPVALLIESNNGSDLFFEQDKAGTPCNINEIETDAKMIFIHFNNHKRIQSYQIVGGSYLKNGDELIADFHGKEMKISVQRKRIEIDGNSILNFQLTIQGNPKVYMNNQMLEVERKNRLISFP